MRRKNIKIALLDSGVNIYHPNLKEHNIQNIIWEEHLNKYINDIEDSNGHGTSIAGIIYNHNKNIDLLSIKILNQDLKCNMEDLLRALDWLCEKDIDIINLSLGTTSDKIKEQFQDICKKLIKKNILIVSAYHNKEGTISYPAHFKEVYGIKKMEMPDKSKYIYESTETNTIYAHGSRQNLCYKNSYYYNRGNSYAAAHFTGILSNILLEGKIQNNLKERLLKSSWNKSQQKTWEDERKNFDWMKKILYYPLSKELISMLEDRAIYSNIGGFYCPNSNYEDVYYLKKDGILKTVKLYSDFSKGLKDVDTFFIGDIPNATLDEELAIKRKLIKEALNYNKNVFCKSKFDYYKNKELYDLAKEKDKILYVKYL
ncbi:S8 family serine peptidase [Tepidibacter mesophilus]|uniref:S8 family serine peptidase n=1 Tax=Tepidibacter mesophilus TaxID=655607 RepID=UPI000C080457|nr:S8 family serine peptidase [Tepidibacter mesophilus]